LTGLPLEESSAGDQMACTIWDETKRYPFAKVTNAFLGDVAYCGFEDASSGNFGVSDGTVTGGDARTGSRYLSLGTTGVTKGALTSTKKYTHYLLG
jgi:hypothetical protein